MWINFKKKEMLKKKKDKKSSEYNTYAHTHIMIIMK